MSDEQRKTGSANSAAEENSLRPAKKREKPKPAPPQPSSAANTVAKTEKPAKRREPAPVPEDVKKRFVQIRNAYFFADGAKAFTDRGQRLTTQSENTEVIRSLVAIAATRGWNEILVRGTERFRREAWAAAQVVGLTVQGYKPTEFEQSRLARSLAGRDVGKPAESGERRQEDAEPSSAPRESRRDSRGRLMTGRLVEHGRAPYQHDMKEPMSYYVKVETRDGDRTLWGVDLERAFKESLSRPQAGDEIGIRSVRQEPVTVKTERRDAAGKVVGQRDLDTHRNHWIVEKREFFEARAEAARTLRDSTVDAKQGARKHPELVGTYLQVHAAEIAAKQIRDPQDRERFVATVREALATSVARGEPLPPVRLKERAPEVRTRPPRAPETALARA
jgi:putative DNA primase/helicase